MLAWILKEAAFRPGYLIGGLPCWGEKSAELGDLSGHAVGLEAQAHPGRDGGEQGRGASEDLLGDHVGDGRRDGGLEDGHERAADPASPLPDPRGDEEHPAAHGPRSPGG